MTGGINRLKKYWYILLITVLLALQAAVFLILRRLGSSVIVRSVKAPRLSSKERGVVYKLSSWSRRGHLRHYQSGKVVWIREQQVHRKAFGDNESGSVTKRDYYVEPELSKTAGRNEAS